MGVAKHSPNAYINKRIPVLFQEEICSPMTDKKTKMRTMKAFSAAKGE